VLDDDKEALSVFRKAGDLGVYSVDENQTVASYEERTREPEGSRNPTSSKRPRLSIGSSISSIRSRLSTQASLSPLHEEGGMCDDDEESPSPIKRRRLSSTSASLSVSTAGRTHDTIVEENSDLGSDSD
jgi:hypothetical protein